MALVAVEVAGKGMECLNCEFEIDSNHDKLGDYCDLFEQFKAEEKRCGKCLVSELSERAPEASAGCGGNCSCGEAA